MNNYYTYAYLREDGTPYYIGKGKGKRAFYKHPTKHKFVKVPEDKTRIVFLSENLTEDEAYKEEIYLIKKYGRKSDGGILINQHPGGSGGREPGWNHTEETKKKMSINGKGISRDGAGTHLTEEGRKKKSDFMSEKMKGNKNTLGRIIPEDERKRKSESLKEYYRKRRDRKSVV